MAMGRRKAKQKGLWISVSELPMSPGHPFYARLNHELESAGFDAFVEALCASYYARLGRPSLVPGRYFRLLLVGYFEGLDSERGMAWRAADSLAIRTFLGLDLDEDGPDHSTISRTRRLMDIDTHQEVFTWVLERLVVSGLLDGKTVAIDATTLEANAAMRSIVRRDSGEGYQEFLKGLAKASGIKTPTRAALSRLDRLRKKKGSNREWTSPSDPDASITRMKDGRTHLAHKAEHAVDMVSGAVVAVTIQSAAAGDTTTIKETLATAQHQIEVLLRRTEPSQLEDVREVVADKGYHATTTLKALDASSLRSYVSEPDRGRRQWRGDFEAQRVVYGNRMRMSRGYGQNLQRQRGEFVERSFAHAYTTGGMRRTHLRGHTNILKRVLIHVGGFNLGLLLRKALGVGTPRGLQGRERAVLATLTCAHSRFLRLLRCNVTFSPLVASAAHGI